MTFAEPTPFDRPYYVTLWPHEVPEATVRLVWATVKLACPELPLIVPDLVEVLFFAGAPSKEAADFSAIGPMDGGVSPDKPYVLEIHAGLTGTELVATVAHELRHTWQFLLTRGMSYRMPRDAAEEDAKEYEAGFVKHFAARLLKGIRP